MKWLENLLKFFGIRKHNPTKKPLLNFSYTKMPNIPDIDLEDPLPRNCTICKKEFSNLDFVARRQKQHFYFCCQECYSIWLNTTTGIASI